MTTVLASYLNRSAWISQLAMVVLSVSCVSAGKSILNPTGRTGSFNDMEGVDISHHQGDINWAQLTPNSSGKQFIIAKATEGATYQDPMFLQNFKHTCAAGFQPGAYHFIRFGSSSSRDQMKNFISQIRAAEVLADLTKLPHKELIIALDIEEHKGADYTLVQSVIEESVRLLREEANITPYIYTRKSFWDAHVAETPDIVKQCPLWIAKWDANPPLPYALPTGWNDWTIWQYSDKGSVPGITGNVDLNRMKIK